MWAASPVRLELHVYRMEAQADGLMAVDEVKQARPGELIEYRVRCTNITTRTLHRLHITLPIPAGLEFTGVAQPPHFLVSRDGRVFAAANPATASPATHRALQWPVNKLAAGQAVTVSARVRVLDP